MLKMNLNDKLTMNHNQFRLINNLRGAFLSIARLNTELFALRQLYEESYLFRAWVLNLLASCCILLWRKKTEGDGSRQSGGDVCRRSSASSVNWSSCVQRWPSLVNAAMSQSKLYQQQTTNPLVLRINQWLTGAETCNRKINLVYFTL